MRGGASKGCRPASQSSGEPMEPAGFNGLIQHSFALRLDKDRRSFPGQGNEDKVKELFSLSETGGVEFKVTPVGDMADKNQQSELAPHSPLVSRGLTTIEPQGVAFLEREHDRYTHELPKAFSWAAEAYRRSQRVADSEERLAKERPWKRFIFAGKEEGDSLSLNDFLVQGVECCPDEDQARAVSKTLCQLLAHRRSMLYGLTLANRFVNVMLPHAILTPVPDDDGQSSHVRECASGSWILQPLVSLTRVDGEGEGFWRTYSVTLFLIPVNGPDCEARKMPKCEIGRIVDAGWGLASSRWPAELRRFNVSGPLSGYISRLGGSNVPKRLFLADGNETPGSSGSQKCPPLTLRQVTEAIVFAVALKMATGSSSSSLTPGQLKPFGDGVVMSLGSSRVSSVVVVDENFEKPNTGQRSDRALPGSLYALMEEISKEEPRLAQRWRYRLDRPFFDRDAYAIGVLPANSCMVITADPDKQFGRWESALMQTGWAASMVVGAANAIGTIRGIHGDLELVHRDEPITIADIENEVVVDLSEIYDLDITWDAYRRRYRRLRDLLGITGDYDALDRKLQAFYRETGVRRQKAEADFEAGAQTRLTILTLAIVALSVILVVLGIVALAIGR